MAYHYGFFKAQLIVSILFALLTIPWGSGMNPSAQVIIRVPQDYPTIQAAVDAAPPGAIILINFKPPKGGTYWEEAITISKSITLRAESITAFIKGPNPLTLPEPWVEAVINIISDVPIQVTLQDLNISQGELHYGIRVKGPARVALNKVYIAYYYGYGLVAESSAHVTLRDSIISGFWGEGLQATNAIVELINSQVSGTWENTGLIIGGSSRVSLQNSTISGHSGGIVIVGPSQMILRDSLVTGNEVGIEADNNPISDQPALVIIENSQISSNRHAGLSIRGSTVELRESFVIGNGVDPKCHQLPLAPACTGSGIILEDNKEKTRVKLRSTEIRNNATWGVAAYLPQCGAPSNVPPFPFEVIFEDDKNVIENNNRSGVLNGMGNPGNHSFKNLPDGQVCLP